ncbi:hypothetical protein L873DRAFT_1066851 [Choiromyces venosus 120613-1]|uniref:Uncharacterized protein n=1 Tax=Choiromyces venosus 120613-1 TaxID=1336337 RepID=A0A3N4JMQ5_9PEZI|nr:hypothetical protein L873DRAFT_1066851 [Choiromyces venosus 120613-1]
MRKLGYKNKYSRIQHDMDLYSTLFMEILHNGEGECEFVPTLPSNLTKPGYLIEHWTLFRQGKGWKGCLWTRDIKDGDCGCKKMGLQAFSEPAGSHLEKRKEEKKRKKIERPLPTRKLRSHTIPYRTRKMSLLWTLPIEKGNRERKNSKTSMKIIP